MRVLTICITLMFVFVITGRSLAARIIIENADSTWSLSPQKPKEVGIEARIFVDRANSIYRGNLENLPQQLRDEISEATPRIIIHNANSTFRRKLVPMFPKPDRIKGDISNDGRVRSNDAILALRISAELLEPTEDEFWAADMNEDGKVRANDAIMILRKAAGLSAPGKDIVAGFNDEVNVTLAEVYGMVGECIIVPLEAVNSNILAGGDICIVYDSSVLRAVDVLPSKPDTPLACSITSPGLINIAFANVGGFDDGTLASIKFEVLNDGVSPISFRSLTLYDSDAFPIHSKWLGGKFASQAIYPEYSILSQNFPNPFNPETWIPYRLAEDVGVLIRIHDANGKLIRTLNPGHKPPGFYTSKEKAAYWDGKNEAGESVSSGVYFYTIQAGDFTATKKMILAK
jgi:hypothetical protein